MREERVPTIRIEIFMAGDLAQAKQVLREYCREVGLCVTISPLDYIYTGGEESGFCVGLINYPRFPSNVEELHDHAAVIADRLRERLCQDSYSIIGLDETIWSTRRTES